MKETKGLREERFANDDEGNENANQEELENGTQNFIQKNSTLIIIVSVVIIGIVGFMYWNNSQEATKTAEANLLLSRILPEFENNNFDNALLGNTAINYSGEKVLGLKAIAEEYKGTSTGAIAAVLAGNSLMLTDKYEEAKEYFEKALSSNSDLVSVGAHAGIAACYEYENKQDEAANHYESAASLADTPQIKERYNFFAGLAYSVSGKKNKALQLFENIAKENNGTEFTDLAKSEMARLGTIIE